MQRRPRRENAKHRYWIATLPCVICGHTETQCAHIKYADARILKPLSSNIGMRADDRFCVPLCERHHRLQHSRGERGWWRRAPIDPVLISLDLYSISGDSEEAERLITMLNYSCRIFEDA
jgi:hypothetical protein